MYDGFPTSLLALLRCPRDAEPLKASEETTAGSRIRATSLHCAGCGSVYEIVEGVVHLSPDRLHAESEHERHLRDGNAKAEPTERPMTADDRMEIEPTLHELDLAPTHTVLEVGCGTGRYTRAILPRCQRVLAMDMSPGALTVLARRLPAQAPVGLVCADIAAFHVTPGSFDRAVSTLVSNLPTAAHREAMYRLAQIGLTARGRFVASTHYHGARERWHRMPREGRYVEGGIYRRSFTKADIAEEAAPFFARVRSRPIQIVLPWSRRWHIPLRITSRIAEHLPGLREFGGLLLSRMDRPRPHSR